MPTYYGISTQGAGGKLVMKDDDVLMLGPSLEIREHSPTGFNWGYAGSGPAQLALALLYDVTGNKVTAEILHQRFKFQFVARWEGDWEISSEEIQSWIDRQLEGEDNGEEK